MDSYSKAINDNVSVKNDTTDFTKAQLLHTLHFKTYYIIQSRVVTLEALKWLPY